MFHHVCTDDFLRMTATLGMVEFDMNISVSSVDFSMAFDSAGHLFAITGSAEDIGAMIEQTFTVLRDKLLAIVDFGAHEPEANAAILGNVAILDEVLFGPSTGNRPGTQATDLSNP